MKRIKIIPILLGALYLLGSCSKAELPDNDTPSDGKLAQATLSIVAPLRDEIASAYSSDTKDRGSEPYDIIVFLFDKYGDLYDSSAKNSPDGVGLSTYFFNQVPEQSSALVVANALNSGRPELHDKLMAVRYRSELTGILVDNKNTSIGNNKYRLLTGYVPRLTSHSICQLEHVNAKVSLKVVDNTPADHSVTMLGWDIEHAANRSYLFSRRNEDVNNGREEDEGAWYTTHESLMSFDKVEGKTAYLDLLLYENNRGWRVKKPLPANPYPGMAVDDGDHRGKAWFAPEYATCIVIHAIHKTPTENKLIEARIFIGSNNYSDYDVSRGNDYQYTVTVNGINDIDVDTNLAAVNGNFAVHVSAPLDQIDAHPDFRPFMISAAGGTITIEVIDSHGRNYNDPSFDATWVKVSPLNLMYHPVRQAAPNDEWQQAGTVGDFVRAKYIPHKSVRAALAGKGGWNMIPADKEDDDAMTFADATHRMCYQITDIPFTEDVITNKTLYVYTDEFLSNGGTRSAQVKISLKKPGFDVAEEKLIPITQNGYLTFFDESNPDAGLALLNEDGTVSSTKRKFGIERYEEVSMKMNPGISPNVQQTYTMQWGNYNLSYKQADKYRNGYFLTAKAVYNDVVRANNEPTGFGLSRSSFEPKYGREGDAIPNYGAGQNSGAPYYYPVATGNIYHPIYKSAAARYCHEKNRDINGDGLIDASETKWYLPAQHELQMIWITNNLLTGVNSRYLYWSATETRESGTIILLGARPKSRAGDDRQTQYFAMPLGNGWIASGSQEYRARDRNYVRCTRVL